MNTTGGVKLLKRWPYNFAEIVDSSRVEVSLISDGDSADDIQFAWNVAG